MANNLNELGLDASGLVQGVSTANKAVDSYINKLDDLVGATLKFNKAGDPVTVAVKQVTDALEQQVTTFVKTKEGFRVATVSINQMERALKNLTQAQIDFNARQKVTNELTNARNKAFGTPAQQQNNDRAVDASGIASSVFSRQLGSANALQVNAFNNAMQRAVQLVRQGKVGIDEFQNALFRVKAGKLETELNPVLNKLQSNILAARTALEGAGVAGGKASQQIFLSWQAVVRIFESRILFTVFESITGGFRNAVQEAASFQKQIALIQTISQDSGVSFGTWSKEIRKVSDELGIPIADATAATYDLLSNQVAKGADAFNLLRTAAEFARTTNSSTTDSVNLLSSAINSFHLNASDAEKIASQFFTIIDLGRTKATDLANSFGRVGVLAESLGVSLPELGAAITTLTRQGISTSEAYTYITNVFNELIKPTKELQGFFQSLNFETGQEAISVLRLGGLLEQLEKKVEGNTAAAAKYFNNIRGFKGFVNLQGEGLAQYKADLEAIEKSATTFNKAKSLVGGTFGQQFEVELNKIKNFFIVDVGQNFLTKLTALGQAFGGIANVVTGLSKAFVAAAAAAATFYAVGKAVTLATAIASITASVYKFTASIVAARTAFAIFGVVAEISWAKVTLGLSLVAGAIAGLIVYFTQFRSSSSDVFEKLSESNLEQARRSIEAEKAAAEERFNAIEQGLEKARQAFAQYGADVRSKLKEVGAELVADQKEIVTELGNQFEVVASVAKRNLTKTESNITSLASKIEETQGKIEELKADRADEILKFTTGNIENISGRILLLRQRLADVGAAAKVAFSANNIKGGELLFERQLKLAKDLEAITQHGSFQGTAIKGNREVAVYDITRKILGTESEIKTVLEQQNVVRAEAARELQKQADAQRKQLADLRDQFKAVSSFTVLDKKGGLLPQFQGDAGAAKAIAQYNELQAALLAGLEKSGASIDTKIRTVENQAEQQNKLIEALGRQKSNIEAQFKNAIDIQAADKASTAIQRGFASAGEAAKTFKNELIKNSTEYNTLIADVKTLAAATDTALNNETGIFSKRYGDELNLIATTRAGLADLNTQVANFESGRIKNIGPVADAYKKLTNVFITSASDIDASIEAGPERSLQNIIVKAAEGEQPALRLSGALGKISNEFERIQKLSAQKFELEGAIKNLENQTEKLKLEAERTNEALGVVPPKAATAGAVAETAMQKATRSTEGFKDSVYDAVRALEVLRQAKVNASRAGVVGGGESFSPEDEFAFGGKVGYFNHGGFLNDFYSGKYASGVDQIPVMAQRGEYIMDSLNTAKFLPILRAMSSGYLSGAGSIGAARQTNIGDINVTVQGGSTEQKTIHNIGRGLRRGIRQGTISLTN